MTSNQTPSSPSPADVSVEGSPVVLNPSKIRKAIRSRTFATLATTSPAGFSHVAGVLYNAVDDDLWLNTMASSRKARNITANDRVAVTIPVRRIPVGPPSSIQFQGRAEMYEPDSQVVQQLAASGAIKSITAHDELNLEGSCFVRITPNGRLNTYGLGLSLIKLIKDPLNAAGSIELADLPR